MVFALFLSPGVYTFSLLLPLCLVQDFCGVSSDAFPGNPRHHIVYIRLLTIQLWLLYINLGVPAMELYRELNVER